MLYAPRSGGYWWHVDRISTFKDVRVTNLRSGTYFGSIGVFFVIFRDIKMTSRTYYKIVNNFERLALMKTSQ